MFNNKVDAYWSTECIIDDGQHCIGYIRVDDSHKENTDWSTDCII